MFPSGYRVKGIMEVKITRRAVECWPKGFRKERASIYPDLLAHTCAREGGREWSRSSCSTCTWPGFRSQDVDPPQEEPTANRRGEEIIQCCPLLMLKWAQEPTPTAKCAAVAGAVEVPVHMRSPRARACRWIHGKSCLSESCSAV